MSKSLLYLNFSPREDSVSKNFADKFVKDWKSNHVDTVITYRDYGKGAVKGPDDFWIKANMTPETQRSPEQIEQLVASDEAISDIHQASHILIATPMFNFSIPWNLKAYIDLIIRVKKTFSFSPDKGFGPLLDADKKLLIVWASAGDYSHASPAAQYDFLTPYLQYIYGFIGITQSEAIGIGNQWGKAENLENSMKQASARLNDIVNDW